MADSAVPDPTTAGDRLYRITDQDHRGAVLVVSIICAVYIPMILALRGLFASNAFGLNECLAIGASVFALLQYVLVWVAISHGFGKAYLDVDASDASSIGKYYVAAVVLYFVALFLTKATVVVLCRKLFSFNMKRSRLMCDVVIGICGLWCLGAILGLTIGCDSLDQIGYETTFCHDLTTRWNVVGIIDAVTECLIVLLAVSVVVPLQMRIDRKISVILAFAPRLITLILIGLHAHYIDVTTHSVNPGVSLATPLIYQQVHLLFAIVSAALPALNRGLRKFHTSMGSTWMDTTLSQNSGKATGNDSSQRANTSIPLRSINKSHVSKASQNRSGRRSEDEDEIKPSEQDPSFRPDNVQYNTATYWGHGDSAVDADARSGQSQESQNSEAKIIRKNMQWQVHYENNNHTNIDTNTNTNHNNASA